MGAPRTDPVVPHGAQPEVDLSEPPLVQLPPQNPHAFPIPAHHHNVQNPSSSHGNIMTRHNYPNFNMAQQQQPQRIPHYIPSGHRIPFPVPQPYIQAPPHYIQPQPFHATTTMPPTNNYSNPQMVSVLQVSPQLTGWTTGLFNCFDDPMNDLITVCIPCITFGQVAEIIDNGNTSCVTSGFLYGATLFFPGCPCILSCTYRTKVRSKFNLIESAGPDWFSHFLCESCALCQEYRELKNRGLDPSIGWHEANTQVLQYQVSMVNNLDRPKKIYIHIEKDQIGLYHRALQPS